MFWRQEWNPLRIAQAAMCAVLVMGVCPAAVGDDAGKVDKQLLSKALAAPASDLAQSYASIKTALSMLEWVEIGLIETAHLGGRKVTRRNATKVRNEFETRLATYRAAIEQRGPMDISGDYTAAAPECSKSGSSWAMSVAEGFDRAVIEQSGPEVTLTVMGEYEGDSLEIPAAGVTVENVISMIDPMNSDYPLTGRIEDGRIIIRPETDRVLKAWPGWARPPKRPDVERCAVTLQRDGTLDSGQ